MVLLILYFPTKSIPSIIPVIDRSLGAGVSVSVVGVSSVATIFSTTSSIVITFCAALLLVLVILVILSSGILIFAILRLPSTPILIGIIVVAFSVSILKVVLGLVRLSMFSNSIFDDFI